MRVLVLAAVTPVTALTGIEIDPSTTSESAAPGEAATCVEVTAPTTP